LHAHSACQCCMSMLHVRAPCLCLHAECPCFLSMLLIHAACPCMSLLHVHATCLCFISMSPRCMSMLHKHVARIWIRRWKKNNSRIFFKNVYKTRIFSFSIKNFLYCCLFNEITLLYIHRKLQNLEAKFR
jgi:hypothetical protein